MVQPGAVSGVETGRNGGANLRVIGVQPLAFFRRQHRRLNQIEIDRRHGDGLEGEHLPFATHNVLRRPHHHEILDADAVFAGFVIAGLIRADHARFEGLRGAARGNALRPFMHCKIGSNAMSGAVAVIEPRIP